jgi:hypothetical protein
MTKGKAQTKTALDHALAYAKLGIPVIWIPRGEKGPKAKGWPTLATTDAAVITQWGTEHPGCNFGLVMGNGVIAVDVDDPAVLPELAERDLLPPTRLHFTPSGGAHLLYRYPADLAIKNHVKNVPTMPGVDIRAAGGQIVCPGSVHPNGGIYELAEVLPIADASPELLAVLTQPTIRERIAAKAQRAPRTTRGKVAEGGRNSMLTHCCPK